MTAHQKLVAIHHYTTVSFVYTGKPNPAKGPLKGKVFENTNGSVIVTYEVDGSVTFQSNTLALMPSMQVQLGKGILHYGAGVCDNYAATFVALASAVGFETVVGEGFCAGNGHAWTWSASGRSGTSSTPRRNRD